MPHMISLSRTTNGWFATHSDPQVRVLFGTDTIPVAFTPLADARTVYDEVKAKNPDAIVRVRRDSLG